MKTKVLVEREDEVGKLEEGDGIIMGLLLFCISYVLSYLKEVKENWLIMILYF